MPANALQRLVLIGAALEAAVALAALAIDGVMAMVAALVGSSIAMAAQLVAVALLRPAMGGTQAQFNQRWVLGIAARFGSFVALAAVMIALRGTLPPAYMAVGYLCTLLVLLFAETRFLR
jgi:hypothetical protein